MGIGALIIQQWTLTTKETKIEQKGNNDKWDGIPHKHTGTSASRYYHIGLGKIIDQSYSKFMMGGIGSQEIQHELYSNIEKFNNGELYKDQKYRLHHSNHLKSSQLNPIHNKIN